MSVNDRPRVTYWWRSHAGWIKVGSRSVALARWMPGGVGILGEHGAVQPGRVGDLRQRLASVCLLALKKLGRQHLAVRARPCGAVVGLMPRYRSAWMGVPVPDPGTGCHDQEELR